MADTGAVDRPDKVDEVVRLLTAKRRGDTVAITTTTALHGEGGFGKTTLAQMVCHDNRVRRHFPGGAVFIELGQELRGPALAGEIANVLAQVTNEQVMAFTSAEVAGRALCAALDSSPRCVLVLDDVWYSDQLTPFKNGDKTWQTLVTTRVPSLLPDGLKVEVDQMTDEQAIRLLIRGTAGLPSRLAADLVKACGRWALLLENVNGQLRTAHEQGITDLSTVAGEVLARLQEYGPATFDVTDARQRRRAVKATLDAGIDLQPALDKCRIHELGIFAEDTPIPLELVADLWAAAGGLTAEQSRRLVEQAAARSLFRFRVATKTVQLHDVVRQHFRTELGPSGVRTTNSILLERVAADLPTVDGQTAWWLIPAERGYLWQHLFWHLAHAGRGGQRADLVINPRWIMGKLPLAGVASLAADLVEATSVEAQTLRQVLDQSAHLLGPTDPPHAVSDILLNRLTAHPVWRQPITAIARDRVTPWLAPLWPMADAAHPALQRVIAGDIDAAPGTVISPDGSWLATAAHDGSIRLWNTETGALLHTATGHAKAVTALDVSADGNWLTSASQDGSIRVWDTATGTERAVLLGKGASVTSLALSPDGTWLAGASRDHMVRIWNTTTGTLRMDFNEAAVAMAASSDGVWLASMNRGGTVHIRNARFDYRTVLTSQASHVVSMAVFPDAKSIATGGDDHTVRIWDLATGNLRMTLTGHTKAVIALAISADGGLLVSGSHDHTVRLWDVGTGTLRGVLTDWVSAVSVSPDGMWIATTGSFDRTVRIWNTRDCSLRTTLSGHTGAITSLKISPDSTWIATTSVDGTARVWDASLHDGPGRDGRTSKVTTAAVSSNGLWVATVGSFDRAVRLWDVATGDLSADLGGHTSAITAVTVSPDSAWVATGCHDGTASIWETRTASLRATLPGHGGTVSAVSASPGGTWLATGSHDHKVRIWDAQTGSLRTMMIGHTTPVTAVAVTPDGESVASCGSSQANGTVRLWDVRTGDQVMTFTPGHEGRITAIAISPSGAVLATAGEDRTVRISSIITGEHRATLTGHTGTVTAVAFAPDGRWLATTGQDQTLRVWTPLGRPLTIARLDAQLTSCTISRRDQIVVGSSTGLFVFEFRTG